ncbi:MAG: TonB-dependent receptor [Woeseia sp.]
MAFQSKHVARSLTAVSAAVAAALVTQPGMVAAQEQEAFLEEVVVTAQRREQSLQEVPLSIEAYSGAELELQGYRNMEDLSAFSPSVSIGDGNSVQDQQIRVRGFGTTGNSLTLEQAVPIFVDGIHFGRQSMIKTAFLDVERVEVLKGPQPVFFGMNATAGAFNIASRRPTPTWEGDVTAEAGSNDRQELSFGVGGPITDTLGIRVAGVKEKDDGFARHIITGEKIPRYDHLGGRVTLEWNPTDNFQATFKVEASQLRNGADVIMRCNTGDSLIYPRTSPAQNPGSINGVPITDEGNVRAIWAEQPIGEGFNIAHSGWDNYPSCFESNVGISSEGPYYAPPLNVAEDNSYTGALDIREAAQAFATNRLPGAPETGGSLDTGGVHGHDDIDTEQAYLNLSYTLDNGIGIDWTSAVVDFYRDPVRDNSGTPFLVNYQGRIEDFGQWSTELRFSSPGEGHNVAGGNIEWMAGLFTQSTTKDHYSSSLRANVRRGQRFNWLWEDAQWNSAFATVTYNFMDDRASIDLGGRFAQIEKEVFIAGYGATWIYDVRPCAPHPDDDIGGGNPDPATCDLHEDAMMVDAADARILVDGADLGNLWTLPFGASRYTPSSWRSPRASAIGLTAPDMSVREGPHHDEFKVNEFDPQVVFRYRLGDQHSLYARWAQAFKAAGYDTGQTSIPGSLDEMKFDAEKGQTLEIGSKGDLWGGRIRYDVALFRTEFTDLQLSGAAPTNSEQDSVSLNAGTQIVQGVEFGALAAVTDRLTLGLQGAVMDSELDDFYGVGCSFAEFVNTRDNLNIPGIWPCNDLENGVTDHNGRQPGGTEDWKFVGSLDYDMPLGDSLEATFNAKGYISSGTRLSVVSLERHGDLNLNVGVGDRDGTWRVSAYGRNLLEPRPKYHRDMDVEGARNGFASMGETVSSNYFATYGVQFRYFYN